MRLLTLRVPSRLAALIEEAARERGATKSSVVREALAAYLARDGTAPPLSFLAQAGDLAGCVSGPKNLSTDRRHLRDYGR